MYYRITGITILPHKVKLFNLNLFLYIKYYYKWILLQVTIKDQSNKTII